MLLFYIVKHKAVIEAENCLYSLDLKNSLVFDCLHRQIVFA